jgi:hypothetical protein
MPSSDDQGFVFAAAAQPGPMTRASAGAIIGGAEESPPWIVVSSALENVLVPSWPGRLWRVAVEEAARQEHQVTATAGYIRAVSVRILEERNAAELFGPHGVDVCRVISKAEQLTPYEVDRLFSGAKRSATAAYERAWAAWLAQKPNRTGSPVNQGPSVVDRVVFNRARELEGDAAFVEMADEVVLVPRWQAAADALVSAALALGAPEIMSAEDRALLLFAWSGVT